MLDEDTSYDRLELLHAIRAEAERGQPTHPEWSAALVLAARIEAQLSGPFRDVRIMRELGIQGARLLAQAGHDPAVEALRLWLGSFWLYGRGVLDVIVHEELAKCAAKVESWTMVEVSEAC